jgi:hypothetical protein
MKRLVKSPFVPVWQVQDSNLGSFATDLQFVDSSSRHAVLVLAVIQRWSRRATYRETWIATGQPRAIDAAHGHEVAQSSYLVKRTAES